MKKLIALGAALLVLASSLPAFAQIDVITEGRDLGLVSVTAQWYGVPAKPSRTLYMTPDQAATLEQIFTSLRDRLDTATTKQEVAVICAQCLVQLRQLGVLGDNDEAQTHSILHQLISVPVQKKEGAPRIDAQAGPRNNYCCFVAGASTMTYFDSLGSQLLNTICWKSSSWTLAIIWGTLWFLANVNPCSLFNRICLGSTFIGYQHKQEYNAYGWIFTLGLNGYERFSGGMNGTLPLRNTTEASMLGWGYYHPAIAGFRGLHLNINGPYMRGNQCYLGTAFWVSINASGG